MNNFTFPETKLAAQLHREWAEARNFEERWKDDGNGGQIDIANTGFHDLPYKWQEENLKAAESALSRVMQFQGNLEQAAAAIHEDWLDRNGEWAEPDQKLPFGDLTPEEQEKDLVLARAAHELLKD